jgi:hypothetical protein
MLVTARADIRARRDRIMVFLQVMRRSSAASLRRTPILGIARAMSILSIYDTGGNLLR